MSVKVLYAPEYGVPQIRKRAVFVGILNSEKEFEYPMPILDEEHFVTCEQALSDLASLENDTDYSLDRTRPYMTEPTSDYQKYMRKHSSLAY